MDDPARKWLYILGIVFALFVVINLVSYIWMPFLPWFEQRDAAEETIEQTYDAENAIDEYEWFRGQYNDIEAKRNQIDNNYDELERFYDTYGDPRNESVNPNEDWSRQTQERHSRIQQRITGNQQQLEQMVAEYNARSESANRAVFKCSLPYNVDERFAISGPPGSGDAEQPTDTGPDGEPIAGSPPPAEQCDGLPKRAEA
jgi:hypothetical protein